MKAKVFKNKPNETITKTYFSQKNHLDRKEGLANEDWNEIYELADPNIIYDSILQKYGKHYHNNKTTRTFTKRSNRFRREPWMTPDILADIRRRDRLSRLKNRREDYKKLRNEIVSKTRRAEREHICQQIENNYVSQL